MPSLGAGPTGVWENAIYFPRVLACVRSLGEKNSGSWGEVATWFFHDFLTGQPHAPPEGVGGKVAIPSLSAAMLHHLLG